MRCAVFLTSRVHGGGFSEPWRHVSGTQVAAGKKPDVSTWPQVRVSAREEGAGWPGQGQGGDTCAAVVSSTFQGVETCARNHLCPHAGPWARTAVLSVGGRGAKVREEGTERDNVGERNKGACGR